MKPEIAAETKAAEKKAAAVAALNNLPSDLGRNRVLDAVASATFWGVSLSHWRRLYRAGKLPRAIKTGDRKLGWRIGDLDDGLAQRVDAAI
jgi:predicted DNA-binding transcriptional regulator AlpA